MDPLIIRADLDLESRRSLIAHIGDSAARIASTGTKQLALDCTSVDTADGPTLGMLVSIARTAQRHGLRVTLENPSKRLRQDIIRAGVRPLFDWTAAT